MEVKGWKRRKGGRSKGQKGGILKYLLIVRKRERQVYHCSTPAVGFGDLTQKPPSHWDDGDHSCWNIFKLGFYLIFLIWDHKCTWTSKKIFLVFVGHILVHQTINVAWSYIYILKSTSLNFLYKWQHILWCVFRNLNFS